MDLDKFLPTTIPRIRKLFLMMREGTMKDDLDRVSGYLENRAKAAAEDLVGKTEELRREEERLAKMEQELVRLRELRNAEKKRITEMKREMSNDRKVVDQAPRLEEGVRVYMRKAVLLIGIVVAGWYFFYRCGRELEDGGCGKWSK